MLGNISWLTKQECDRILASYDLTDAEIEYERSNDNDTVFTETKYQLIKSITTALLEAGISNGYQPDKDVFVNMEFNHRRTVSITVSNNNVIIMLIDNVKRVLTEKYHDYSCLLFLDEVLGDGCAMIIVAPDELFACKEQC